jgi:hypothetical protein
MTNASSGANESGKVVTYREDERNTTSYRLGAIKVSLRAEKEVLLALGLPRNDGCAIQKNLDRLASW